MGTGTILFLIPVLVLIFLLVPLAIRIIKEYERLVVLRLGRALGARGPGLVVLIPFVDRGIRVDLREVFFDVDPQTCITKDNAPLSIDFLVYMKVINATASVLGAGHRHYDAARPGGRHDPGRCVGPP